MKLTMPWTLKDIDLEVEVDYELTGRYHSATHYAPAEWPEFELHAVRPVNLATGEVRSKPIVLDPAASKFLDARAYEAALAKDREYDDPDDTEPTGFYGFA